MDDKYFNGVYVNYFEPQQDIRENNFNIELNSDRKVVTDNWDKLKQFIEWDSLEATIKNYKSNDYIRLWNRCKEEHINLLPKHESIKKESIVKDYDIEDLRRIFNEKYIHKNMCDVIEYILWFKKQYPTRKWVFERPEPSLFDLSIRLSIYDAYLETHKDIDEKELDEAEYNSYFNAKLACAFLYHKIYVKGSKEYEEFKPIADLIYNHIQFMNKTDLKKLLDKFGRYLVDNRGGHNKKDIPVYVFDKYGEMIKRYNNRQECMNVENIGKPYMSLLLSGKRRKGKCFYCEMTDEQFKLDEEKYKNI